jgi:uncharacterized phiE125 gp8 family phage protein
MRSYGSLSLTESSPPQSFDEPLSLAAVKSFLNLPERSPADEAEDAMLGGFISAAREQAEYLQGRDLVLKQYDLSLDSFESCGGWRDTHGWYASSAIQLRQPLVSVDLVQHRDSSGDYHESAENIDYVVDRAKGLILPPYNGSWPSFTCWPSSAVLIRFTSGLAPDDVFWAAGKGKRILVGMKQLVSAWFSGRLPFEANTGGPIGEFPFSVSWLLGAGGAKRVR